MAAVTREHAYEHIFIELVGKSESGKTSIFDVCDKRYGGSLGTIRWFGRWRQYAFFPEDDTIYSAGCLDDIADFIRLARERA